MKIIEELVQSQKDILVEKCKSHYLFETHIKVVLNKAHCYRVNLYAEDYQKILIHAGLPIAGDFPYQTLSNVQAFIKNNPDFLKTTKHGILSGTRVQEYLEILKNCQRSLYDCFVDLGDCFMLDKGEMLTTMRNEITDGMHRLVAYGVASDLTENFFPIPIFFGTDKPSEVFVMEQ